MSCDSSGHLSNPSPPRNFWERAMHRAVFHSVATAGRTDSPEQSREQTQPCTGQSDLGWSVAVRELCLHFAAHGDPWCHLPGDSELTCLPGDGFQVAGASRQLAGVEPQAATTVRGLLAGLGLDGVAGVLQREGQWWLQCHSSILPLQQQDKQLTRIWSSSFVQGAGEAEAQGSTSRVGSLLLLAGSDLSWPPQPQHTRPVPLAWCHPALRG